MSEKGMEMAKDKSESTPAVSDEAAQSPATVGEPPVQAQQPDEPEQNSAAQQSSDPQPTNRLRVSSSAVDRFQFYPEDSGEQDPDPIVITRDWTEVDEAQIPRAFELANNSRVLLEREVTADDQEVNG